MDLISELIVAETEQSALDEVTIADAVELLVDVYDGDGAMDPLADAVHHLADHSENEAISALVDWWGVSVGRASTGACWNHLNKLPDSWAGAMTSVRDAADLLPAGTSPRHWLDAARRMKETMSELDSVIGYHGGNYGFAGERAAWLELVGPFEKLSETIRAGGIPDSMPEVSDSIYRRAAKAASIKVGSDRDRFMKRMYKRLEEHAAEAVRLAETANVPGPQVDIVPMGVPEGIEVVDRVARRVLRVLTGEQPQPASDVARRLDDVAGDCGVAGLRWLSLITWYWHQAHGIAVPGLEASWADRRSVLDEVRRLRRSLPDDDLDVIVELAESDPDLVVARGMIEDLQQQESERGRRQSVLDRVHALRRRVEELDPETVQELGYRLGLIEADVADGRLDDAEAGLEDFGPEIASAVGEVRRARVDVLLTDFEALGAGPLAAELGGRVAALDGGADDTSTEIPEEVLEEFDDRLAQVRAEATRKVSAVLERVEERADTAGAGLDSEDLLRLQRFVGEARSAVERLDLPRAEVLAAQASAFLDQRVVPTWGAGDGEAALVQHVVRYLQQSVHFAEVDIRRLHVALKSKRFVILAGLTGTGKSTIARLYAEALDATNENGRFRRVAVRPNWVDETEVLGFLNPTTNRFEPGWLAALFRTCHRDPDLPVFCVLDEMNLAPVEQYLADVLSAMEEQPTTTEGVPIPLYSPAAEPRNGDEWPSTALYPDNLFLIGTVNVDETTRPLSERVLDRANVLQLSTSVDRDHHEPARGGVVSESRWRVRMGDWAAIVREDPYAGHHEFLIEVGEILARQRIGIGIRSHLEIERFCANALGILDDEVALDHALLQRVIPKVRGFKSDLVVGLEALLVELEGVGAESCARVVNDWLADDLGDDTYLDGTAAGVGLAAQG